MPYQFTNSYSQRRFDMRRLVIGMIVLFTSAWTFIGSSDVAIANGLPACFFYDGKPDPNMVCIVTKIDGHRLCMVAYDVRSNYRYQTEECEFIRDIGNVKTGDHIIINADEWKWNPHKCNKSPGCGKVIVKKHAGETRGNAAVYTNLEDICRDGKKSIGKDAEIGGLFLADCFPETINFHTNQRCVTTVELKPSPAVYAKLKPYEFKNNLRVRFRITQTYIENNHIKGEFIAMASGDAQPAAQGSSVQPMFRAEPPITLPTSSRAMGWRYVGKGDCTGMDVGGLTMGSTAPETKRCTAASKGMTAVCWDGQNLKHYGSNQPQCTYKNISPNRCSGGGSPGHMYECVEMEGYVWVQVGNGDCTGKDVRPLSMGSAEPKPELCNAQFLNKTAVCWDGSTMKHWGSDKPQCTYKDVAPDACTGGGSPGYMYKCVYQTMGPSSQRFPDAGVTAGETPSYQHSQPQQGFVERTVEEGVQIGVKKGMESLKGIFK